MVRDFSFHVGVLLDLPSLVDEAEKRATWRQAMAALARAMAEESGSPLDGLHPEALLPSVRVALASGLVDDLTWLSASSAGAALYELASVLAPSVEKRELARRVQHRMLSGSAETFAAIATRMALGAGKGLDLPGVRSRVALLTELPTGASHYDGALAMAMVARRSLARDWIVTASMGSLPSRRLAARLLERAAREAARRAALGDEFSLRAFRNEAVATSFRRLLADREPLVWRHVAVARGLLAHWMPSLRKEVDEAFDPKWTPTEWRRGATSLAAMVAIAPDEAMKRIRLAVRDGLLARQPGLATAFVWGLPRASETEPDAASELLELVLAASPFDVATALVEVRAELPPGPFLETVAKAAVASLQSVMKFPTKDDGAAALMRECARELQGVPRDHQPLSMRLDRALQLYETKGAIEAYTEAKGILQAAYGVMGGLLSITRQDEEAADANGSISRRAVFAILRDMDVSLLERNVLFDLLRLGGTEEDDFATDESLDTIRQRITDWVLERETTPLVASLGAEAKPNGERGRLVVPLHPTLRNQRLRTLLHVVDSDVDDSRDDVTRLAQARMRWLRVAHALGHRFEKDPPSVLRRMVVVTLARAVDALVRFGMVDVTDILLGLGRRVDEPAEFEMLWEAAMDPDLVHGLGRYVRFLRSLRDAKTLPEKLEALEEWSKELTPDATARTEAVRTNLALLHSALRALAHAKSLRALASVGHEPDAILALESSLASLAQLCSAARSRLEPRQGHTRPSLSRAPTRALSVAVARVLSGTHATLSEHVVAACLDELVVGIPKALAQLVMATVWALLELPVEGAPAAPESALLPAPEVLPAWLPTRRTLGGFYVVRAIGGGGVSSVFLVNRVEERNDAGAEKFALKVPEYSATAARSVSEDEFLKMFRAEASALLLLPTHPNLARFVTFDVGARPKPILVMEFVEGVTLERTIESGTLDIATALRVLREVLLGLEAMHAVEVGHLDLKPSNVMLRKSTEAVLVDFGLTGRHIRPGCATGPYGAPEVWGVIPDGCTPTPMKADVYAFGCLAFEVLTGKALFSADNEMMQVALHVGHDGDPLPVRRLGAQPGYEKLASLLKGTLRRDPRQRFSAAQVRVALDNMAAELVKRPWPVAS